MDINRQTNITDGEEQKKPDQDMHQHLHHHHLKAIIVMLGFTCAQFFFMGAVVSAGELTIKALLECTNLLRLDHKQPNELVMNEKLTVAAENKLQDMEKYKYWAHENPITGRQPWDFVDEAGYYYETTGENLAYGFTDSQKICNAWEKSPKHLANIANPTFQEIGFAVDKANLHKNEKGILVVQIFGSRDDFTPAAEGSAASGSTTTTGQNDTQQGEQSLHETSPEVKGTASQKTATSATAAAADPAEESDTQADTVRPEQSLIKSLLPYAMGVSFLATAITAALIFRFKKNRKKVKMIKVAAMAFAAVAAVLTLLFFFFPSL